MLYLTALLFAHPGAREGLREYEEKTLAIFRRHGGEILAAFVPEPDPSGAEQPDEIHILRIADSAAFAAYLADPERQALAARRDSVLRKSEVFRSGRTIPY
jgi:uncharacterized protein (DUF1330 family)